MNDVWLRKKTPIELEDYQDLTVGVEQIIMAEGIDLTSAAKQKPVYFVYVFSVGRGLPTEVVAPTRRHAWNAYPVV